MKHSYTRQRQGRDFPANNSNTQPKDDAEEKKSLLDKLEHYKTEAERNSVPIDGHEPPEKGRNLV